MYYFDHDGFSRKCYYVSLGLCGLAGILILACRFMPAFADMIPPCEFHRLTGYYCPGCGGTRAFIALSEGRFIRSLYYHPAVIYFAALLSVFTLSHTVSILSGGRRKGMPFHPIYFYISIFIILSQCIIKNLMLYLFNTGIT